MLTGKMKKILEKSRETGWVLEPDAKALFAEAGLPVPAFKWATTVEEAVEFANETGYPVVAKIISPKIIHKSDAGGVVTGIQDEAALRRAFKRLATLDGFAGVLVEESVEGVELIAGAKNDAQFGPVVLLGMGGTGVEIYNDVSLRMAPLSKPDVRDMVHCLKAAKLLEGYRGAPPVNMSELSKLLVSFSSLVMDLEASFESIDLNPLMCSPERCVIADARIMLKPGGENV